MFGYSFLYHYQYLLIDSDKCGDDLRKGNFQKLKLLRYLLENGCDIILDKCNADVQLLKNTNQEE